jgi:hypothetical protein
MGRDLWRLLAWLATLSVLFWAAVALHSCDGNDPRPSDVAPRPSPDTR